eukprot:gene11250-11399_t
MVWSTPGQPAENEVILICRVIVDYVNGLAPGPLGGADVDQALATAWVDKLVKWDGNLFLAANSAPGAAKVLAGLQSFKIHYAEARAKENPDLRDVYSHKIKSMQDSSDIQSTAAEANKQELVKLLDEAEQQLESFPFLAGNCYSVADVVFTPVLFRLGMANKTAEYLKPRPSISAYYN